MNLFRRRPVRTNAEVVAELTERIVAHNARMTGFGHAASKYCTAGCGRCCAMIFAVTPAEVEVIAAAVQADPLRWHAFLGETKARELRRRGEEALWLRCQAASSGDDPALKAWYALDIRCAFNVSGSCLIYPIRPLACSLYNSIVPAEVCAVEPKSWASDEMRALQAQTRSWLLRAGAPLPTLPRRLDVSWQVLRRLEREHSTDNLDQGEV